MRIVVVAAIGSAKIYSTDFFLFPDKSVDTRSSSSSICCRCLFF
jgi:hypothetical protein